MAAPSSRVERLLVSGGEREKWGRAGEAREKVKFTYRLDLAR